MTREEYYLSEARKQLPDPNRYFNNNDILYQVPIILPCIYTGNIPSPFEPSENITQSVVIFVFKWQRMGVTWGIWEYLSNNANTATQKYFSEEYYQ